MTYPRTPEEKAGQLGARFACAAFNACGSLDAKKCQEMGDALGEAIAELVREARGAEDWYSKYERDFHHSNQADPPPDWQPSEDDLLRAREARPWELDAHMGGPVEEAAGREYLEARILPPWSYDQPLAVTAEPAYMRCHVCTRHRDTMPVIGPCGHDTGEGANRRWFCSKACGAQHGLGGP